MLAETVVIGYGSAEKRLEQVLSSPIKRREEIASKPYESLSSLQGKVAVCRLEFRTGRLIRNPYPSANKLHHGYKPLCIVSGLFFNDNIILNQSIESMEILKDPSSLSYLRCSRCERCDYHHHKESQRGQTCWWTMLYFRFQKVVDRWNGEWFAVQGTIANNLPIRRCSFDYTGWNANTRWDRFQRPTAHYQQQRRCTGLPSNMLLSGVPKFSSCLNRETLSMRIQQGDHQRQ